MNPFSDYQAAPDLLAGRTILVTGASQGVGRAVALAYARHGATVVLLARNVKKLEAVYDEILAQGGAEPAAIPFDLLTASDSDMDAVALKIYQELGGLDGIVHCASHFYALSPLVNQTLDEWLNQFRINTAAPAALTRACLPLLKRSADASVIAVGEAHGVHPKAYWGGFAVSHAGLSHWVNIAASEWDDQPSLRINLLIPGRCSRRNGCAPTQVKPKSKCRRSKPFCPPFCIGWGLTVGAGLAILSNLTSNNRKGEHHARLSAFNLCLCAVRLQLGR